ncbi:unnamed protein product [Closterium sp. NIES-64]|nr:unnamed protein product [Closterium sp. NIES-64]CAI6007467.1 unnamed protein product [Closterium sp. NIES-65]CAI6009365.1 unnamed protein product [Closterium sp. NIES-65]CAI6012682.1 unnamed protein product [Closterium sp. NIES-65]
MWRVTSASIRRSVRHLPQATASPAALFPYAHSSAAATPATRSDLCDSSPCPLQPSPHKFDDKRTHALDSPQILSIAGASRWFRIAGGNAGSGMGTGGVRWRSAISGAGGGGDDGSENDGQGGELPPAAVAVEGEASGGDVAEAVDLSPPAAIAPYLAAVQGGGEGRQRRRRQYGTYGDDIEEEAEGFEEPADEAEYRHLYDARGVVDKWLGDPALWGMLSADALGGDGEEEEDEGEGPELRWETRMVLGPGGDAWHPANRKVKVSVFVRELQLSRLAKERLLALVGRRYNTHRDELTIVSERYSHREENRKDVFRILHALIAEAKQADQLAAQAAAEAAPVTCSQAASLA